MVTAKTIVKKLSVQTVSVFAQALTQLIFVMTMARLLTERDFGIFAVVSGIQGLALVLSEAGIGASIVQTLDGNKKFCDTAFTFSLILGIICALIVYLFADVVAVYNRTPELSIAIKVSSLTLLFNSLCSVPRAILQKNLSIFHIFVSTILPMLIGYIIIGTYLAFKGYGYWSMLWAVIVYNALKAIMFLCFSKFKPCLCFSLHYFKRICYFSMGITGAQILNVISTQTDKFVLGGIVGISSLGAFNRVKEIITMLVRYPHMIVDMIMFPTISRYQNDLKAVCKMHTDLNSVTITFSTLLVITLTMFSKEIILFILGSKWLYLAPIFDILIFSIIFNLSTSFTSMSLRSLGLVYKIAYVRLFACITSIVLMILLSRLGLPGVAFGMLLSTFLAWILMSVITCHALGIRSLSFIFESFCRFGIIVLVLGLPLYGVSYIIENNGLNIWICASAKLLLLICFVYIILFRLPLVFGKITIKTMMSVCDSFIGKKNIIYTQLSKLSGNII